MNIISLGGVGGCELALSLRDLNQLTYPYDWLVTTQSFIFNSFNNFENFFSFEDKYVYQNTKLLDKNKKAVMLHDFNNFAEEKNIVIEKYKRRFERLETALNSSDNILFVRLYDNLEDYISSDYTNIFYREEEDINNWENFISDIKNKYNNKNIKLLIITNNEEICNKNYNNIILYYTKEYKNSKVIYDIIKNIVK
jgi:hypothetical protein